MVRKLITWVLVVTLSIGLGFSIGQVASKLYKEALKSFETVG